MAEVINIYKESLARLYKEGSITEEKLDKAILKGWITAADKEDILLQTN